MSTLLDTNVVLEWTRPQPDAGVMAWFDTVDEDRTYVSVVTLAELHCGVEGLPAGRRRSRLEEWLRDDLLLRFEGRVLPVDADVAKVWGRIVVQCNAAGRPITDMDAFIAATARVHGLQLATRNVRDFEAAEVPTVNPWNSD